MNDVTLPAPSASDDAAPADVLGTLLAQRYSCRGFLPQPVPRTTIERILKVAQRTASWCNAQPWQVIVTSGAATERFRDAICRHALTNKADPDIPFPREYRGVYLARRRECGFQLYDSVGIKRGDREASARQGHENFRLFGAPHVVEVKIHPDGRGLLARTRDAAAFHRLLNSIVRDGEVDLEALAPADDDVGAVYEYLIGTDTEVV